MPQEVGPTRKYSQRERKEFMDRIAELEATISGIKGELGECFDGIEDAPVHEMIHSAGRFAAWAMGEKCKAEARVAELEQESSEEKRVRGRVAEAIGIEMRGDDSAPTLDFLVRSLEAIRSKVAEGMGRSMHSVRFFGESDVASETSNLRARVADIEAERDDYKVHFEEADKQRLSAIDRVAELESRLKAAHERADKVEPEWHRLGDRVAELEAKVVFARLPKVWVLEIASREVVLRYENGHMSACATMKGGEEPESFVLKRDGVERIAGWPEHPDDVRKEVE